MVCRKKVGRAATREMRGSGSKLQRAFLRFCLAIRGLKLQRSSNVSPKAPTPTKELKLYELDFQRLSVGVWPYEKKRTLRGRFRSDKQGKLMQAKPRIQWLNLDPSVTTQRQFLRRLEKGLYRFEFRIVTMPRFGAAFSRIKLLLFPLSRYSQWAATAVVAVERAEKLGILAYGSLIDDLRPSDPQYWNSRIRSADIGHLRGEMRRYGISAQPSRTDRWSYLMTASARIR
jgi:hypothetical protein